MAKRLVSLLLAGTVLATLVSCAPKDRSQATAKSLLNKYGWSVVGDMQEGTVDVPSDFALDPRREPWRVNLDLSKSVGLDFCGQAGKTLRQLRWRVRDPKQRLAGDYEAVFLVDSNGQVVGDGWVPQWSTVSWLPEGAIPLKPKPWTRPLG